MKSLFLISNSPFSNDNGPRGNHEIYCMMYGVWCTMYKTATATTLLSTLNVRNK